MDSYKPGHIIPACQIELDWAKKDKQPEKLDYKLYLVGVNPPGAYLRITRKPMTLGQEREVLKYSNIEYSHQGAEW